MLGALHDLVIQEEGDQLFSQVGDDLEVVVAGLFGHFSQRRADEGLSWFDVAFGQAHFVAFGPDQQQHVVARGIGDDAAASEQYLAEMFAMGPDAVGSRMAGRAETFVGDPDTVARSVSILAADLTTIIGSS